MNGPWSVMIPYQDINMYVIYIKHFRSHMKFYPCIRLNLLRRDANTLGGDQSLHRLAL